MLQSYCGKFHGGSIIHHSYLACSTDFLYFIVHAFLQLVCIIFVHSLGSALNLLLTLYSLCRIPYELFRLHWFVQLWCDRRVRGENDKKEQALASAKRIQSSQPKSQHTRRWPDDSKSSVAFHTGQSNSYSSMSDQDSTSMDESSLFSATVVCPAPVCRQFWKAGNYDIGHGSKATSQSIGLWTINWRITCLCFISFHFPLLALTYFYKSNPFLKYVLHWSTRLFDLIKSSI